MNFPSWKTYFICFEIERRQRAVHDANKSTETMKIYFRHFSNCFELRSLPIADKVNFTSEKKKTVDAFFLCRFFVDENSLLSGSHWISLIAKFLHYQSCASGRTEDSFSAKFDDDDKRFFLLFFLVYSTVSIQR